eukprot:gnl/Spiro4/74_TR45_c0_g1_i1.p1 gnl/Spiro4/74_TR45_c0_g1~~gnl/Spiro4/74_TR45_c0_g1_i1.p1  ORF type:complete len:573 (+),score=150.38 gnl/Spiro4/74_TR45_c0_g1_i1:45-1763(+)
MLSGAVIAPARRWLSSGAQNAFRIFSTAPAVHHADKAAAHGHDAHGHDVHGHDDHGHDDHHDHGHPPPIYFDREQPNPPRDYDSPKPLTEKMDLEANPAEVFLPFGKYKHLSPWQIPLAFDPSSITAPAAKVSRLSNGLRVASLKLPTPIVSVGAWIDCGSRFETEKTSGCAHFLEHMAFKGTKRRGQAQLEREVEDIGGHLNAYTSREMTVYYAKVHQNYSAQAVDILADILQNSTFNEDAIAHERHTILREMEEVNKTAEERVLDMLHMAAYPGHPLGMTILGPKHNIETIQRQDLVNYTKTFYTAPRMVISAAGNIEHEALVELAQKHFGSMPSTPPADALPINESQAIYVGGDLRDIDQENHLAHFSIAYEGVGWNHPDTFNFMVMQHILGNADSSNEYAQHSGSNLIRGSFQGQEGLDHKFYRIADNIKSFNTHYKDTGLFGVCATCPYDMTTLLSFNILKQFQFLHQGVDEHDVERGRNQLKHQLATHLDSSAHVAEELGRHLLVYGRHVPQAEMFQRIENVTVESVRNCAMRYINDRDPVVAARGDIKYVPDYQFMRRQSFSKSY